jgi:hypothetical protein
MGAVGRDLYVDQLLTQMAIGYKPKGMIADLLFPKVGVQKQSGMYSVFSRADVLRIETTARAPGTMANQITRSVSTGTYFAKNYALDYPVNIEDKANADPIFTQTILNGSVQFLVNKLALDWERRIALLCTSGSNVGSYSAISSGWLGSGATPIANINTALDNVQGATGVRPNRIVFGDAAWRAFRRHSTVQNIIFGANNGGGYPSVENVKSLFEVDNILIGGAYVNTANEAQAESLSQVWGDNVLAYYAPSTPMIDEPSFGYSFRWNAPGLADMTVERHPYDSRRKVEDVEVGYYQDEKITGAAYGFLLTATTSST